MATIKEPATEVFDQTLWGEIFSLEHKCYATHLLMIENNHPSQVLNVILKIILLKGICDRQIDVRKLVKFNVETYMFSWGSFLYYD